MDVPKKIQDFLKLSLAARNIHAAEQVKLFNDYKEQASAYLTQYLNQALWFRC